ncbi:MAG: Asp-tRNA(Asn)/Glu-tRNA(Gln) amidotransferase GatCAB subunit A [Rhodospirillaceae bacterium]|nr:Asp-tRNA(Asn)/Glu-tRNA(Gln) amidotransferase GatCAB subunit A [Rhodospirillaceae bacterium]OUT76993.1 MAG: aspartyl/glutamyl-tRNA amidotransferase subunit A [Rhodospirillaceae bacterium TMED23]|tara:strand:- start:1062 stop:2537 length:1476 start_codon:yes stop_codon:yes gene_type:complete
MLNKNMVTITKARQALENREYSSLELTKNYIEIIESNRNLNAFITETPDIALKRAEESDVRRAKGDELGSMDGIPIAIKDLFCTEGVGTTAGSRILENFIPPYESTVTQNLRNSGAVMLGKTNMDEFAMGSANVTSYFGPVKNAWFSTDKEDLVPGGSSGGSAAAVSADLAIASIGSDTGGSIRQPASFCGIVGMKPTYGRCSRWGMVAFASSLDQAGPMTKSVRDAAIMLQSMVGFDPKDSTSVKSVNPNFESSLTSDIRGLRVGIPQEYRLDGLSGEINQLWQRGSDWLTQAGAIPVEISLPHTKYALPTYYIVAPAEASSNLARYDGVRYGLREPGQSVNDMYENTRGAGFGEEVRRRIMIGTHVLSAGYYDAYYVKAMKLRTLILEDFQEAFKSVDIILTPTAPSAAFAASEKMDNPIQMYMNDVFTVPASLAGLPAMSIPAGLSNEGLPLGLHLIAKPFDEETLFRFGGVMEEAANFKGNSPQVRI